MSITKAASAAFVSWQNTYAPAQALLTGLLDVVRQSDLSRSKARTFVHELPPQAQELLGAHYVENHGDQVTRLLMVATQAVLAGKDKAPTEFVIALKKHFSRPATALATIETTFAGGGTGRKMYRISAGAIAAISGGLTVKDGDVICLLVDDDETHRFVSSGNLVPVGERQR
jgi:hypothetical protein